MEKSEDTMSTKLTNLMALIEVQEPTTWFSVDCCCKFVNQELPTLNDLNNSMYSCDADDWQRWESEEARVGVLNRMKVYQTLLKEGWVQKNIEVFYNKTMIGMTCTTTRWVWISPECDKRMKPLEEERIARKD